MLRVLTAGESHGPELVAVAELGAREVEVVARRPEAIASLAARGERLGIAVRAVRLAESDYGRSGVTLSTLPGDAAVPADAARALAAAGGLLFDVVYGHGQTPLAAAWHEAGHPAVGGENMLLHQAVLQIRIFVTGDADAPLPDEPSVLAVMRRALVGG